MFDPLEVDVVGWAKSLGLKSRWLRTLASSDWSCLELRSTHGRTTRNALRPSESRWCPGAGLVGYLHAIPHLGNFFLQARCKQTDLQSFNWIQSGAPISSRLEARPPGSIELHASASIPPSKSSSIR